MRFFIRAAVIACGLCYGQTSFALNDGGIDFITLFTIQNGGDERDTAYTQGSGLETNLSLGDAFSVNFGAAVYHSSFPIGLSATAGYSYAEIKAIDGKATLKRFPIEGMVFFNYKRLRVSGGLAYHISPRYKLTFYDGSAGRLEEFSSALGAIVTVDMFFGEGWSVGARYTDMEYEISGNDFDASSVGAQVGWHF